MLRSRRLATFTLVERLVERLVVIAIVRVHDRRRAFPMGRDTRNEFGQSWAFRLPPMLEQPSMHSALVSGSTEQG